MAAFSEDGVPQWLLSQIYAEDSRHNDTTSDLILAQRLQNQFNHEELMRRPTVKKRENFSSSVKIDQRNGAIFIPTPDSSFNMFENVETVPDENDEFYKMMREQEEAYEKAIIRDSVKEYKEVRFQEISNALEKKLENDMSEPRFEFDVTNDENVFSVRFRCPNGSIGPIKFNRLEKLQTVHQFLRHHLQTKDKLQLKFPMASNITEPLDTPIENVQGMEDRCLIIVSILS